MDDNKKTDEEIKRFMERMEFAEFIKAAIIIDCDEMYNRDTIRAKARQLGISFL